MYARKILKGSEHGAIPERTLGLNEVSETVVDIVLFGLSLQTLKRAKKVCKSGLFSSPMRHHINIFFFMNAWKPLSFRDFKNFKEKYVRKSLRKASLNRHLT